MATQTSNQLLNLDNLQLLTDLQVVIVYTEWNEAIVNELKAGAMRILNQFPQVEVVAVKVPGCVEIPNMINHLYHNSHTSPREFRQVFIALGCVIRGETPHFTYVCQAVTNGISILQATRITSGDTAYNDAFPPIIFGILTVNNEQEALDRIGGKHGHKGEEAAAAALKVWAFQKEILQEKSV
jgi:6,7-dimethyl-8-ribityllumazine synthase